jgi:hypothetical protein
MGEILLRPPHILEIQLLAQNNPTILPYKRNKNGHTILCEHYFLEMYSRCNKTLLWKLPHHIQNITSGVLMNSKLNHCTDIRLRNSH